MTGGYLNGSGYPDPTAYKAMNRMEDKVMEANRGEIWRYMVGDNERDGIVVGVSGEMYAVYHLIDDYYAGCVAVITLAGKRFIHPCKISYTLSRKLLDYVQDVSEDDMEEITDAMRQVFNLPEDTSYASDDGEDTQEEIDKLWAENQKLLDALKEAQIRERLMADQYNMLLDRMLGKANG